MTVRAKTANGQLQLPDHLRDRFEQLEHRLWKVDTVIAICGALTGLLISWLLVFVSDRFWDTPAWLRTILMTVGVGVLFYFVAGWLRLWVWRPRDYRSLSGLVQRHFRRLGDRLLGIVELADEKARPPNISPALCRAAIQQVSTEAVKFDFREAVATRKPKIYFIASVLLIALVLAPWLFLPQASRNALSRWLQPASDTPRYTFVSLEQMPSRMVVAHGEAFEIQCGIKANSFWKPVRARCQFGEQKPVSAPVVGDKAIFRIPGQTKRGNVILQAGDARREIVIEPMHRPALRKMLAQVELPKYLQHPASHDEVRNGALTLLEGSQVIFKGIASRPLSSAKLAIHATNGVDRSAPSADSLISVESLNINADQFISEPQTLRGASSTAFTWTDSYGLSNVTPWPVALQFKTDDAPEVECPDQPAVVAMLEEEAIDIKVSARDDFGLRDLSLVWDCQKRNDTNAAVTHTDVKIRDGHPMTNALSTSYRFSPSLLHLPTDSLVTLRAAAADYHPNRKRTESATHKIFILSREEHAQLVQQQFEKIAGELEELTRREEGLEEATRESRDLSSEKLAAEETGKKIGEQATEQNAIAEKMSQLNRMAAETMREAMRNKSIPPDTLQEWTQHMETMQKLAQSQMPQASQSLSSAQSNPQNRPEQLKEANQTEQQIVQQMQDMQKKMSSTLDRMMANTLAQRLRKIAKTEKDIGQDLHKTISDTIGLVPERLPTRVRDKGLLLAANQEQAGKHTHVLGEEISRFYDRTTATNYGTVAREMKDSEAAESLGRNAELIRRNIAAQAIHQTTSWSDRFNQWAALLDAARKSSKGSGSGGGEGEMSEEAIQRLLALLRLRQEEVNVRDLTGWLEQHKQSHATYGDDTVMLSLRQSLLVDDATQLESEGPSKYLPQARDAMKEADGFLRKPRTDEPVVAVETDAVNLLEAEIMSMFKSCDNPSQSAALAMLMEMMGMKPGQAASGKGNYAGGEAEKNNLNVNGDPTGAGAESRSRERTAGRDLRTVPAEFREALQNYYKALERLSP